jgi:HD-like signal output (HDOD) protein
MSMQAALAEPRLEAHELVSQVVRLTTLPGVYLKVKKLVEDPDSSLMDVAEVIAQDPAMTMQILRIANSAFFGFAAKIPTVSRAVNLLGTQQVHDLALAASVAKAFEGISPEVMDMQRFWRDSIHCGIVARILAVRCNVLDSERLFVEGLLRNIGHVVLYDRLPEQTSAAVLQARETGQQLFQVERELLGFDYAQVGAMLMREWQLPQSLQESVHYHPEPTKAQTYLLETCIVHVASQFTEAMTAGLDVEQWSASIDPLAWRTTQLSEDVYDMLCEEAEERTAETVALFFPNA